MPNSSSRAYFDPSVYVSVLVGNPVETQLDACQAALEDAEQGNMTGVFSSLVVAETIGCLQRLVGDGTPGDRQIRLARARDYFDTTRFTFVEDSPSIAIRAADFAIQYDLTGPDALHLALAQTAGCERFFSLHKDHLKVNRIGQMTVSQPFEQPPARMRTVEGRPG